MCSLLHGVYLYMTNENLPAGPALSRIFYLRTLQGKASRIKAKFG